MQLLIWGTGCTAGVLADRLGRERIAGFVDSFGPEQSFLEKPIYRPAQLSTFPYDLILVARGRTVTASWKELNDTFVRLCRKLELLEEEQ